MNRTQVKDYIIFDELTGEIQHTLSVPESSLQGNIPPGCSYREVDLDNEDPIDLETHYIDTEGAPQTLPARPSQKHKFNRYRNEWQIDLQDAKDLKWEHMKAARDAEEFGVLTWDGSLFEIDELSQQRIAGAVQLATLNSQYSTEWTLYDNTTRLMTAADFIALGTALGIHVATAHAKGRQVRVAINQAKTVAEVEAISWPAS